MEAELLAEDDGEEGEMSLLLTCDSCVKPGSYSVLANV